MRSPLTFYVITINNRFGHDVRDGGNYPSNLRDTELGKCSLSSLDPFDNWRAGLPENPVAAERTFNLGRHGKLVGGELLTAADALVHESGGTFFFLI